MEYAAEVGDCALVAAAADEGDCERILGGRAVLLQYPAPEPFGGVVAGAYSVV